MGRKVVLTFENNEAKDIERVLRKKYDSTSSLEALCVRVIQEVKTEIETERHGPVARSLLPHASSPPLDMKQEIKKIKVVKIRLCEHV